MTAVIRGVVPPLVTPLHEDRSLDIDSLERSIERQIAAGIHGLFVLGSSGEVVYSTDERRREILSATMRIVDGRIPVLAGVIDTQTQRVIDHIHVAEDFGVDAIVATAPFYGLGGPANVERHFRVLSESTSLPIFAYDIPVCVHTKLTPHMLVELGREGVLAGVKDSSGDDVSFRFLVRLNEKAGHPLQLLTGHEVVVDGAYLSGADGCVPGLGNVDPHAYVRQWDAYQAGDWQKVRLEQDRLADLMTIALAPQGVQGFGAGVGSFKTALQLMGIFSSNQMPEPVQRLEGDNVERIAEVLRTAGLVNE